MKYHETPKSSNIARIGHDPGTLTMHVHFTNGSVYEYPRVAAKAFEAFKNADSHGSHFSATFRGWPCKKIS